MVKKKQKIIWKLTIHILNKYVLHCSILRCLKIFYCIFKNLAGINFILKHEIAITIIFVEYLIMCPISSIIFLSHYTDVVYYLTNLFYKNVSAVIQVIKKYAIQSRTYLACGLGWLTFNAVPFPDFYKSQSTL